MSIFIWLSILMLFVIQEFDVANPLFLEAMTSALATIPFSGAPMTSGLVGAKLAMGTQLLYNLGFYGTRPKLSNAKPKKATPSAAIPKAVKPASDAFSQYPPMKSDFKSTPESEIGDTDLTLIFQALRNQGFDPTTALQMIERGGFGNLFQGAGGFGGVPQGAGGFGGVPQGAGGFGGVPQGARGFSDLLQGAGGFGDLLQGAQGFGDLLQGARGFGDLLQGAGRLPQGAGGLGDVPQGAGGLGDVPQGAGGLGDVPQGAGGLGDVPQGAGGLGDVPQGAGGLGDVPQDAGEGVGNLRQDPPVSYAMPDPEGSTEDDTEEIFTFMKEVDEDGCMSRLVCEIGRNPNSLGIFSDSLYGLLKSTQRGASSVVDQYIDVMETGRRGGCEERYPYCSDSEYNQVMRTLTSGDESEDVF